MLGKSGDKFKPWIKIFMIPLALSGVLCFSKVPFEGVALHAWVAFVYVLYGMSYTGTSMPFGAFDGDGQHRSIGGVNSQGQEVLAEHLWELQRYPLCR